MSDIQRIEDNVRTMIGKGAPEADIDAYLKGEGHTADSFRKAVSGPGTAGKIADAVNTGVNWAGTQFTKGLTGALGAPRMMGDLNQSIAEWAGEKLGAPEAGKAVGAVLQRAVPGFGMTPTTEQMNQAVFKDLGVPEVNAADNPAFTLTNPLGFEGKVNLGKMADAGMQALPLAAAGPGGAMGKAVPAFAAGATSEAGGQATEGTPWEIPTRIATGALGAMAGAKAVSPNAARLTANQQRAVDTALAEGVPMTVGQQTGRGEMRERMLSRSPWSSGPFERVREAQNTGANAAAWRLAGVNDLERVDPMSVTAGRQQVSQEFNNAVNGINRVELRPDFYQRGQQAIDRYATNTPQTEILPGVARKMDDFFDPKLMGAGPFPELTGRQFQEFRKGLGDSIDDLFKSGQSGAARALQGVRTALDDAAQASLPRAQQEAMDTARRHYANFKILEKSAMNSRADARNEGNLSAGALHSALRSRQGTQYASQTGGMNDVANMMNHMTDSFPNSGTPTMQAAMNPLSAMTVGVPFNLWARARTGGGPVSNLIRDYLANQSGPQAYPMLYGPARQSLPFALVPGARAALPQLEARQ